MNKAGERLKTKGERLKVKGERGKGGLSVDH